MSSSDDDVPLAKGKLNGATRNGTYLTLGRSTQSHALVSSVAQDAGASFGPHYFSEITGLHFSVTDMSSLSRQSLEVERHHF